jgi:hypothetical protein
MLQTPWHHPQRDLPAPEETTLPAATGDHAPSPRVTRMVLRAPEMPITRGTWDKKSSSTINGCAHSSVRVLVGPSACGKPLMLGRGQTPDIDEERSTTWTSSSLCSSESRRPWGLPRSA